MAKWKEVVGTACICTPRCRWPEPTRHGMTYVSMRLRVVYMPITVIMVMQPCHCVAVLLSICTCEAVNTMRHRADISDTLGSERGV